jgi:hypothetical protein
MQLFLSLQDHLRQSRAARSPHQIDGHISAGEFEPTLKHSASGHLVARFDYTCLIFIEQYKEDARYLIALVSLWLKDATNGDSLQSTQHPQIEIDPDGNSVDVVIRMGFSEDVFLIESPTGLIEFDGRKWGFGDDATAIAETGDVFARH